MPDDGPRPIAAILADSFALPEAGDDEPTFILWPTVAIEYSVAEVTRLRECIALATTVLGRVDVDQVMADFYREGQSDQVEEDVLEALAVMRHASAILRRGNVDTSSIPEVPEDGST